MINGNIKGVESYGTGAVIALLAIAMVFIVLMLIIFLTELVSKFIGKESEKEKLVPATNASSTTLPLNINDEDAVVACLVASIDYRNETKKNIQVVSVKEVK